MARKRLESSPFPNGTSFVTVYMDSQPNQRTVFRLAITNCTDRLSGIVETMFLSDGSTEGLAVGPGVESLPVSGGGVETIGVGPRIESLTVSDGNTEVV